MVERNVMYSGERVSTLSFFTQFPDIILRLEGELFNWLSLVFFGFFSLALKIQ